ncbi:MAG: rRNA maturation RNase YbeY [Candidatus Yanofskybacteria bacterium]|nr:rRNA maturation RNase YbeY [Candidatus Yanofskybacteria bacterium]
MLNLVFRNSTSDKKYGSKFFEKILKTAARELKIKGDFSVSVNLVSELKIRALNKKYRNKDKPTDVLSFPLNFAQCAKFADLCGHPAKAGTRTYAESITQLPDYLITDIGDIFVCLSIAKKEAKRENVSIDKKLAQLTAHGFLHLLGYDHEKSKKDAEKMFELESQILRKIPGFKSNIKYQKSK